MEIKYFLLCNLGPKAVIKLCVCGGGVSQLNKRENCTSFTEQTFEHNEKYCARLPNS